MHGAAWAGEADIVKVEDLDRRRLAWIPATLGNESLVTPGGSGLFMAPKKGDYSIQSRATDSQGRVQPSEPVWNPSGYLYNAIDEVKIHVA